MKREYQASLLHRFGSLIQGDQEVDGIYEDYLKLLGKDELSDRDYQELARFCDREMQKLFDRAYKLGYKPK
jgi:hypothetical protein